MRRTKRRRKRGRRRTRGGFRKSRRRRRRRGGFRKSTAKRKQRGGAAFTGPSRPTSHHASSPRCRPRSPPQRNRSPSPPPRPHPSRFKQFQDWLWPPATVAKAVEAENRRLDQEAAEEWVRGEAIRKKEERAAMRKRRRRRNAAKGLLNVQKMWHRRAAAMRKRRRRRNAAKGLLNVQKKWHRRAAALGQCYMCLDNVGEFALDCRNKHPDGICGSCADTWISRQPSCPICRAPTTSKKKWWPLAGGGVHKKL